MGDRLAEIKEDAISYLDVFEAELPQLINELRAADTRRMSMLGDITEGAKWLMDAVAAVSNMGGESQAQDADRLADALSAIEDAIMARDYTMLADILEYELLEMAADWRKALE